jgi:hypothetical protein
MASDQFVIDGICRLYNFLEANLKGRFGRIFNDVHCVFHSLINPPESVLSKDEAGTPFGSGAGRRGHRA